VICDAEVDAVMPDLRRRREQPDAELAIGLVSGATTGAVRSIVNKKG
jgi:hypothetical protein